MSWRAVMKQLGHLRVHAPDPRARLGAIYDNPIAVPVTQVWGEADTVLRRRVAREADRDAGRPVQWRPLPGVGHVVSVEAPVQLPREIDRVLPRRHARPRAGSRGAGAGAVTS